MADEFSFDVVSKVDLMEVENAVTQANKEISTRFDFRGSVSRLDWDKKEKITLYSDDDQKLKSVVDILQSKLVKRGVALNSLDYKPLQSAEKASVRQEVLIKQGIPSDKAKEIAAAVKDHKFKARASIQGEQLRVTSGSKDELQAVMQFLRAGDFKIALQFTNFR